MSPDALPTLRSALIPALSDCPTDDPIFALDAEAKRRSRAGEHVVNATLGSLMEDSGELAVLPTVFEAFQRVDRSLASAYAPLAGTAAFRRAVIRDVFGDGELARHSEAVATAGGTGAIHCALTAFLEPGQSLLTTDFHWGPYATLAGHAGCKLATFSMFNAAGGFDLNALEESLDRVLAAQGRALLLLNSPCHNPTGYSLTKGEWEGVAEIVRSRAERAPISLLVDLAYARYASADAAEWHEALLEASESATLLVAWSASKAFAQYGSRIGALLAVAHDPRERARIQAALTWVCRGTWSNCNHLGLLAVTDLLEDQDLQRRVAQDRERLVQLLSSRVAAFKREAQRVGLRTPRYEGGFFVLVYTPDAKRTAEVARSRGVFVVPTKGAVRVAICSTSTHDIPQMAEALAEGVAAAEAAG